MLSEYFIVEYALHTKHTADRTAFLIHSSDVDYLWSHVSWSTAPDKNILRCFYLSSQPKVDYNGLASQYYVVGFDVAMGYSFFCHLRQPSENSSYNTSPLLDGVLG